jgi:protein disulfide-isomerase
MVRNSARLSKTGIGESGQHGTGQGSNDADRGRRFVEHFMPTCSHCQAFAPTWQTLYEFYYTSSPIQSQSKFSPPDTSSSVNGFHGFYNFHFARIDCTAFGDTCEKNEIKSYPSLMLYKNGHLLGKYTGEKTISALSHFVEEKLEQIRPGSRPREGLNLPEVGAKSVDRTALPEVPLAKDKDTAAGVAAGEKHNDEAAALAETTSTAMLSSETAKAGRTKDVGRTGPLPNLQGTSLSLTAEAFQRLVTTTQDSWFIKFYAPWCKHCQALAPTWEQMAKEMKGQLNIGEVNCDYESRLCKEARVQGYPTMYYFRGGERVEYEGLRGLGDLLSFAKKALDSDVKYVDAAAFKEMEETEEVIFTYFYDHATTSEDFTALGRLTLSLIGHAKIVKTDSPALAQRFKISTWPRLLVSRDGRPTYYTALAPKDMRDFRKVLTWMQSVWLPIVPELSIPNAQDILSNKFVVLGVLSRNRPDDFIESKRELKNAALEWMDKQTQLFQLERQEMRDAKQLRIDEAEDRNDQRALRQAKSQKVGIQEEDFRKQVTFAWVDGVFWERWLRSTYGMDVMNSDRVIINDEEVCYHQPCQPFPTPPFPYSYPQV